MESVKLPTERPQAACRVLRDFTALKISRKFVENDEHSGHRSFSINEEEVAKVHNLVPAD